MIGWPRSLKPLASLEAINWPRSHQSLVSREVFGLPRSLQPLASLEAIRSPRILRPLASLEVVSWPRSLQSLASLEVIGWPRSLKPLASLEVIGWPRSLRPRWGIRFSLKSFLDRTFISRSECYRCLSDNFRTKLFSLKNPSLRFFDFQKIHNFFCQQVPKSVGISGCSERPGAFFVLICSDGPGWPCLLSRKNTKNHHKKPFFLKFQKKFFAFFWQNVNLMTSIILYNNLKPKWNAF